MAQNRASVNQNLRPDPRKALLQTYSSKVDQQVLEWVVEEAEGDVEKAILRLEEVCWREKSMDSHQDLISEQEKASCESFLSSCFNELPSSSIQSILARNSYQLDAALDAIWSQMNIAPQSGASASLSAHVGPSSSLEEDGENVHLPFVKNLQLLSEMFLDVPVSELSYALTFFRNDVSRTADQISQKKSESHPASSAPHIGCDMFWENVSYLHELFPAYEPTTILELMKYYGHPHVACETILNSQVYSTTSTTATSSSSGVSWKSSWCQNSGPKQLLATKLKRNALIECYRQPELVDQILENFGYDFGKAETQLREIFPNIPVPTVGKPLPPNVSQTASKPSSRPRFAQPQNENWPEDAFPVAENSSLQSCDALYQHHTCRAAYYFSKAATAYRQKKYHICSFYSEEGRQHKNHANLFKFSGSSLKVQAALDQMQVSHRCRTLDLHGLTIAEALQTVREVFEGLKREVPRQKCSIYIIVGRGSHSSLGRSRIRKPIEAFLRQNNFSFYFVNEGSILTEFR
eukprot:Sdes_comp17589_c0_seq1m6833